MKKTGLLLLLVPTLFLASCQTTPKVDTITEQEAREFIKEHFKDKPLAPLKEDTKIWWDIKSTKEDIKTGIKKTISGYIYAGETQIADDKNDKGLPIDSTRLSKYADELTDDGVDFGQAPKDAVIGMNETIFEKLYHSGQNDVDPFALIYKPAGKGLTIISQSTMQKTIYTRAHYYDENGQEKKFEVNVNKDNGDYVYTMRIEFKY